MPKPSVALVICLLSIVVAACGGGSPAAPSVAEIATPTPRPAPPSLEKPTYTVQRGVVADELKLSGRVSATLDEDVFFTQDGFVKTLFVNRTDVVTQGQLLAELDLGTLPNELQQAEVSLSSAESALNISASQQQFAIRKAQLDLEDARAQLAVLQKAADPREVEAARIVVQRATIALQEVRNNASAVKTQAQLAVDQVANLVRDKQQEYARTVELIGGEPGTPEEAIALEQSKRALENAETDLEQAKVAYELARQSEITAVADAEQEVREAQIALETLQKGPTREDVAEAQRAIRRAQVTLEEAQSKTGDPEEAKRVEQARLDVENMRSRIETGRIYAPFAGQIAEVSVKPGDSVAAYSPVLNIINPTDLDIVIDGTLTQDLARIGVGQQVNLTFSRYPTQPISGTVEKLPTSLTSTSSTVESDPAIHVSFDRAGFDKLDVGDLATLVLVLEQKPDALWLPPQAVRSFDGRRFVVVQDGERQRRVDIKVGIVTTDRIEILEGLKEGDVVIGQ